MKRGNKTILVTMTLWIFAILIASAVTAAPGDQPNGDAPGDENSNNYEGEIGENDGGGGQNQNNNEGENGEGEGNQNQNEESELESSSSNNGGQGQGENGDGEQGQGENGGGEQSQGENGGGEQSQGETGDGEQSQGENGGGEQSQGETGDGEQSQGENGGGEQSQGENGIGTQDQIRSQDQNQTHQSNGTGNGTQNQNQTHSQSGNGTGNGSQNQYQGESAGGYQWGQSGNGSSQENQWQHKYRYQIQAGIENGSLPVETTLMKKDGNIVQENNHYMSGMQVQLESAEDNKVRVRVSAEFKEGKVLALNIDDEVLRFGEMDQLRVCFDGEPIELGSVDNIIEADGDESTYVVALDKGGAQFLVYIPSFSEHVIDIESLVELAKEKVFTSANFTVMAIGSVMLVGLGGHVYRIGKARR